MPIVQETTTNLLDAFDAGEFEAIIHGCTCRTLMGAGIAAQIASRYPGALLVDMNYSDSIVKSLRDNDLYSYRTYLNQMSGTFSCVAVSESPRRLVINAYTQLHPGAPTQHENRLDLIRKSFQHINEFFRSEGFSETNQVRVGIPKIGAGLAGGDWAEIFEVIQSNSDCMHITLSTYQPKGNR